MKKDKSFKIFDLIVVDNQLGAICKVGKRILKVDFGKGNTKNVSKLNPNIIRIDNSDNFTIISKSIETHNINNCAARQMASAFLCGIDVPDEEYYKLEDSMTNYLNGDVYEEPVITGYAFNLWNDINSIYDYIDDDLKPKSED